MNKGLVHFFSLSENTPAKSYQEAGGDRALHKSNKLNQLNKL